jgi:hypothetical protein
MSENDRCVWVIESGEYSDYHVVGVFSSLDNAQVVYDAIRASEGDYTKLREIACWPLDPITEELRQGFRQFYVLMLRDGTVEAVRPKTFDDYQINGYSKIWRRSTAPFYRGKNVPDCLDILLWAKDETQAIKAANEHRAMMIANGEW